MRILSSLLLIILHQGILSSSVHLVLLYLQGTDFIFLYSFKYPKFLQLKVLHSAEYGVQHHHLSKVGTTMICDC